MYVQSIILMLAIVGETGIATEVIDTGSKLANLGAASILGIVALAAIIALVKVFNLKQSENKETIQMLHDTIQENTRTLQALKDNCTRKNP